MMVFFLKKSFSLVLIIFFYLFIFFFVFSSNVLAIRYDLIAPVPPEGGFTRGQTVRFTINIDTEGASVTSTQIGMTYDTRYLEYVMATPGEVMTSVSTTNLGEGKLLFSGTNNNGFSGQGTFAYVDLKIIAQAPGSTELCVLWAPSGTPAPTNPPPTSAPQPTALPTSGITKSNTIGFFGTAFVALAVTGFFLNKKNHFKKHQK